MVENTFADFALHWWAINQDITEQKDRTHDDNHNHRVTHIEMRNTQGKVVVFFGGFLLPTTLSSNPPAPTPSRYGYTLISLSSPT